MLSESELKHLASILGVSDVTYMGKAQVIYMLAQRIAALELEVELMKERQNG